MTFEQIVRRKVPAAKRFLETITNDQWELLCEMLEVPMPISDKEKLTILFGTEFVWNDFVRVYARYWLVSRYEPEPIELEFESSQAELIEEEEQYV